MSLLSHKGGTDSHTDHRQTIALDGKVETFEPGPDTIRPLGDNIYIQRVRVEESRGGIIFPSTFRLKKQFSARERLNAVPDLFHAFVLAIGPDVRELSQGDEIIVHAYAEGNVNTLWTGTSVGEKDRMFIKPNDVVCAVER